MRSKENQKAHQDLIDYIWNMRSSHVFDGLPLGVKVNRIAEGLLRKRINYGIGEKDVLAGARFRIGQTAPPATWKRRQEWGDNPPGLDCGGFVELVMYIADVVHAYMYTYRDLREPSHTSKFYKKASGGADDYHVNWIPRGDYTSVTQDAGLTGSWPHTVHLAYHRKEFASFNMPEIGDMVFFHEVKKKGQSYTHVGIWGEVKGEVGIIHSSPKWSKYDLASGPKFTKRDDPYYTDYLKDLQESWEEWFGAPFVRPIAAISR